ncbi:hypothetical protein G419_17512 [Rhodococcus triatomae BKS 15-14]|nr:hypothetical protein G419_17512 [Rhodococcus triatomae BKS 15-14]
MGEKRGEVTVLLLDLNRLDLVRSRMERITKIRGLVSRWYDANEPLKGILAESIRVDANEGEFTAAVVAYLEAVGFPW